MIGICVGKCSWYVAIIVIVVRSISSVFVVKLELGAGFFVTLVGVVSVSENTAV